MADLSFIVDRDAKLSEDGKYRYWLKAIWNPTLPIRVWIMLNPSDADATVNDPTFLNCVKFSRLWGDGGIVILNLFAFRSPFPKVLLKSHAEGVNIDGPDNEKHWAQWLAGSGIHSDIIVAWGNVHPKLEEATTSALSRLHRRDLWCLGKTASFAPKHPLARGKHRIPPDTRPQLWRAKMASS